ncbi:defensin-like protein 182 [Carica papaya]|uniref:defensin-like protein 182 n=1 Tax=Carica papaya TaxID=3649 RepID=UPI000B8C8A16|nr:defensin-like protein 182 [Carica papaya]
MAKSEQKEQQLVSTYVYFIIIGFNICITVAGSLKNISGDADICSEPLGYCGNDCESRCLARHIGVETQGSCDYTLKVPLCTCYYSCNLQPPPPETCNDGLGYCTVACEEDCCNRKCSEKHYQGRGLCNEIGTIKLCQCQYPC